MADTDSKNTTEKVITKEVTLLGFPYKTVAYLGLAFALTSMIAVWFSFEDRE